MSAFNNCDCAISRPIPYKGCRPRFHLKEQLSKFFAVNIYKKKLIQIKLTNQSNRKKHTILT